MVYIGNASPQPPGLGGCRPAATLNLGVDNEETGRVVWTCTGPAGSWRQAWPNLVHLSA